MKSRNKIQAVNEAKMKYFAVSLFCVVLICALVMPTAHSVLALPAKTGDANQGTEVTITVTATVTVLGVTFPYTFEDPDRGTKLYLNPDNKTFRFTALDGYDSGVVWAERMKVKDGGRATIHHHDSSLRFQCRTNTTTDYCSGLLTNKENKNKYRILDPKGVE